MPVKASRKERQTWGWSEKLVSTLNNSGVAILCSLAEGPKRYSDLSQITGLQHPTLDRKLDTLRDFKLVDRRKLPEETRDWYEYFLLKAGKEFADLFLGFEGSMQKAAVEGVSVRKGPLNHFMNSRKKPEPEAKGGK